LSSTVKSAVPPLCLFYIGFGPETAAAECFSAVRSAITAAKNPAA
jgi:hypothetical protein